VTALLTFCPPAHSNAPVSVGTYGPMVCDLAATVGLQLDPEQRLALDVMYAHDRRGRLVATEYGLAAPRRNIKTHVAKAASLADLVLFGQPDCLWTAHLRDTAYDAFRNDKGDGLADLFDSYDHLRRLVEKMPDSDGETAIRLRRPAAGEPTPALAFVTRSERGGRGLSGRRVTFDEALFLKPSMLSALLPVLAAESIGGAVQVRYMGSAGLLQSAVWRGIRDRGRRGGEPRLSWLEWAAPHEPCELERCTHAVDTPGCALDRPHLIRAANLALDRRIDLEYVLGTERRGMDPVDYACERLGWWQDPPNTTGGDLDMVRWGELHDTAAQPRKPLVVGVDQGEDRTVSIGVAWRRADGGVQVMLAHEKDAPRPDVGLSPAAAVLRLAQLRKTWGARVLLGGPALGLERELLDAGVPVEAVSGSEFATACGQLDDRIRAGAVHHGAQSELTDSVGVARWRAVGTAGERAFQLRGVPGVGPAAAVVRALHGVLSRPATTSGPVAITTSSAASDVTSMQF
jgi:hypothetical protein